MKGFYGRILNIDLTQKTSFVEEIPEHIYKRYLGGKGLATYLLYQRNKPKIDPLSPGNNVIFGLGPTVNTKVYGSSRYGIFTLSPQTGILAHSYSGGRVAEYMGHTGFDAFVIGGAALSPTVLEISEIGVTFHDGSSLWGLDTYQAQDEIQKMMGSKIGAMVIGPAGENLVRFAMVANNYWRSAGRGGVGAVLGSKNIKGLAFHGMATKEIAEPEILDQLWNEIKAGRKENPVIQAFNKYGTSGLVSVVNKAGAFPTRYWSKGQMDKWENIDAEALHSRCEVVPSACAKCLMACGRMAKVREGRHQGLKIEGPEYETIYAFGGLCEIEQIEEIVYLNDSCDRLGIDTISAGNLAAFAIEASIRGKIKERFEYNNPDVVSKLLKDIAYRRGVGKVLAEGIRFAAKQWKMEDIAIHVKGMEPSAYDPRVLKGMGLAFATSDRGACHLRSTVFKAELSGQIAPDQIEGKAKICIDYEDRLTLQDALIVCRFYRDIYVWDKLSTIIHGTTGIPLDQKGLKKIAANIRDTTQRFNRREGITKKEDMLPDRFFKESISGGKTIQRSDLETMLREYYRLRGWDEKGVPPEINELHGR